MSVFGFGVLVSFLCLTYPWTHNFLRYIAESFILDKNKLTFFIRLINIFYFPVFPIVFYYFTFGDFAILSGWETFRNGEIETGRLIAILTVILLPILVFLSSITYGFMCASNIKNPDKVTDEDYYWLWKIKSLFCSSQSR